MMCNPELLHLLGLVSYQLGEFDDAIEFISRAIAIKPSVAEYRNHLGSALRDNGRLDEAIAACRQAIELREDYPMAHFNLGNALKDKKQFAEAMESYVAGLSASCPISRKCTALWAKRCATPGPAG